jgi:hypothetical protein
MEWSYFSRGEDMRDDHVQSLLLLSYANTGGCTEW